MNIKFGDSRLIRLRLSLAELRSLLESKEQSAELTVGLEVLLKVSLSVCTGEPWCCLLEDKGELAFYVPKEKLKRLSEMRQSRENSFVQEFTSQVPALLSVELDRFKMKESNC